MNLQISSKNPNHDDSEKEKLTKQHESLKKSYNIIDVIEGWTIIGSFVCFIISSLLITILLIIYTPTDDSLHKYKPLLTNNIKEKNIEKIKAKQDKLEKKS
ncbi:hypothetical protein Psal071_03505 (plasmid) [Piscirickettsia salmonis]|uniref:Uncharacterized protein n=1 Tax=Piscirickettsia salmonis TaxID=1238 RepID=A0A9Q6PRF2_PISSA|nr:hypothetical protein Psal009_00439 [Piscirickettsia salmonis]QGO35960.1 hypothetical protein Psal028_03343 [Piscirickettsia salmonis]QGO39585.1 hypothetical protein Psal040_03358 [Piscirickettsia salmonis]QGO46924.1 hypothetical protein Psal051_03513 [Piscirickettsia salmonis]QGO61059.1 hypothetical protein Psal071_03505 [Piscirickettsia salmonis]